MTTMAFPGSSKCTDSCQKSEQCCRIPRLYKFATKTAYHFVTPRCVHVNLKEHLARRASQGWTPVELVCFIRHGCRHPGPKDIINLNRLFLEQISKHSRDPEILNWKPYFKAEAEKDIVDAGLCEQVELGKRYKEYFPELLSREALVTCLSSDKPRTVASCKAFQSGLWPVNGHTSEHTVRNDLLRFFVECEKYMTEVRTNPDAVAEWSRFIERSEVRQLRREVTRRLGLDGIHDISYKELKALYVVTGSELAVFNHSVWAKVFKEQDLDLLEYSCDVKAYWKKGYGYSINYQQACHVVQEVLGHFQDSVDEKKGTATAVHHFGHAETIFPLLCLLGLYHDTEPLTAEFNAGRKFRTTNIMPYSSNLSFVLYQSTEEPLAYCTEVIHNERPVALTITPTDTMCSYETFRDHLLARVETCSSK